MAKLDRFFQNGGRIKLLLWILFILTSFLLRTGWTISKYDSRLNGVESKVAQHEEIIKSIPQIKEDVAVIRSDIGWIKRNIK